MRRDVHFGKSQEAPDRNQERGRLVATDRRVTDTPAIAWPCSHANTREGIAECNEEEMLALEERACQLAECSRACRLPSSLPPLIRALDHLEA
jgi:hypothetical protein